MRNLGLVLVLLSFGGIGTHAFVRPTPGLAQRVRVISQTQQQQQQHLFSVTQHQPVPRRLTRLWDQNNDKEQDDDDDDEFDDLPKKENPYADPSYPDLEFIDYSDPNYSVDQGVSDEMYDASTSTTSTTLSTEEEVEAMREERRRRNDEFQFQTFFANILKGGDEHKGEWTLYKTSTFLNNNNDDDKVAAAGPPRLVKASQPLYVVSHSEKKILQDDSLSTQFTVERERIVRHQRLASAHEVAASYRAWQDDVDTDTGFGKPQNDSDADDEALAKESLSPQAQQMADEVLGKDYGPVELCAADFRGPQGIMCVSNAYTLASGVPLDSKTETTTHHTDGPFAEYRAEVGLTTRQLRYNIKLDYAVLDSDSHSNNEDAEAPSLHLRSLVVGREMRGLWPRSAEGQVRLDNDFMASSSEALFGIPGADNGLYDAPPVGSDEQAALYLQLDLDGRASALFPYRMEQTETTFGNSGWVMSLDWTPNQFRYQVDRKVMAGDKILGLRTLELSEVQAAQAETYRPRGPREDMRQ